MKPVLIIFVKEPRAGQVKTRLARDIGAPAAVWWYRHQTARLLHRLGRDRRWVTVLAVSPDGTAFDGRAWPAHLPRCAQGQGDLGVRMARALRSWPTRPVVLIGSDVPDIRPRHIAEAFGQLGRHDAVLGPARDGGFWLIGLKRGSLPAPKLFRNVRWSGSHAMEDTMRSMPGLRVGFAETLKDVDTAQDL